jgi:CheY-like chemotaxis protein
MQPSPHCNKRAATSLFPSTSTRLPQLQRRGSADRVGKIHFHSTTSIANWPKHNRHTTSLLAGSRILVVEDDGLIATDLVCAIEEAGAYVIGPASSVASAQRLIKQAAEPSAAILDIRLDCELVFTIADTLLELGIPLIFYSAFECDLLPERFAGIRFVSKSLSPSEAVRVLQMEMALERADCRDLLADSEPEESVVRITVALLEIARNLTGDQEAASILVETALNQALECSGMRPPDTAIFRWLLEMMEDAWMSGRWLH